MSFFKKKISISDEAMEIVLKALEISGASSLDEFAEKALLKEAELIINQAGKGDVSEADVEDIANKLKGLGYLD
jgi:predicted CopG family antitoxin